MQAVMLVLVALCADSGQGEWRAHRAHERTEGDGRIQGTFCREARCVVCNFANPSCVCVVWSLCYCVVCNVCGHAAVASVKS